MRDRRRARELAYEYISKGDPTGWFEALYKEGETGTSTVPWADGIVNPFLLAFWTKHPLETAGKTGLVVGCGQGDDAEQLAAWGYRTTAFDVSATAIGVARQRFPSSTVDYRAADLFAPPPEWHGGFDFVFEAFTIQALPNELRARAIERVAAFVKPDGKLLIIARGRTPDEPTGEMPWPLTHADMALFLAAGLTEESFEEFFDTEEPPARRFRGLYARL